MVLGNYPGLWLCDWPFVLDMARLLAFLVFDGSWNYRRGFAAPPGFYGPRPIAFWFDDANVVSVVIGCILVECGTMLKSE